jgi:Rod binding domain-containing protein
MEPVGTQGALEMFTDTRTRGVTRKLEGGKRFDETLDGVMKEQSAGRTAHGKERQIDRKLMDVCIQAESLFVGKMLKAMRNTVPKGEFLHGGFAEDIFEDMLYDEYAVSMSRTSNLGLARMMYDELSRSMPR